VYRSYDNVVNYVSAKAASVSQHKTTHIATLLLANTGMQILVRMCRTWQANTLNTRGLSLHAKSRYSSEYKGNIIWTWKCA
jgi:hypothetical protein